MKSTSRAVTKFATQENNDLVAETKKISSVKTLKGAWAHDEKPVEVLKEQKIPASSEKESAKYKLCGRNVSVNNIKMIRCRSYSPA